MKVVFPHPDAPTTPRVRPRPFGNGKTGDFDEGHVSCLEDVSETGEGNGEYENGRDSLQDDTSFSGACMSKKRV